MSASERQSGPNPKVRTANIISTRTHNTTPIQEWESFSLPGWTPRRLATTALQDVASILAWHRAPVPRRNWTLHPDTAEVLRRVADIDWHRPRAEDLRALIDSEGITAAEARTIIDRCGWPRNFDLDAAAAQALTEVADEARQLLADDIAHGTAGTRLVALRRLAQLEEVAA